MISLDEINKTILDLENHDTTYATCEKLAWLYIVKDHLIRTTVNSETTVSFLNTDSEFLEASSNKNIDDLLAILDEHMEVVKVIYPREYNAVIEKIREL